MDICVGIHTGIGVGIGLGGDIDVNLETCIDGYIGTPASQRGRPRSLLKRGFWAKRPGRTEFFYPQTSFERNLDVWGIGVGHRQDAEGLSNQTVMANNCFGCRGSSRQRQTLQESLEQVVTDTSLRLI